MCLQESAAMNYKRRRSDMARIHHLRYATLEDERFARIHDMVVTGVVSGNWRAGCNRG